ncbi:MAG TPA: hypothetical protein IAB66_03620 [Candidatus Caccousia avistercoris]|nr:hypothetical protein [Candidatus Caccousia avistercoris]
MLRKLMKYEFQATARYFLPMYLLLVVFAALTRLIMSIPLDINRFFVEIPTVVLTFGYVAIIVAIFVMTLVITVQRFYKNLLSDEGYLMFTLPVKISQHIWSKLIVAFVWTVASVLVTILSIFIFVIDGETIQAIPAGLGAFFQAMGSEAPHSWLVLLLFLVLLVLWSAEGILQIYAAIVLGCQSSKHKMLAGIGCYLGFNMVLQLVTGLLLNAIFFTSDFWEEILRGLNWNNPSVVYGAVELGMLALALMSAAVCAVFYIITHQMLKRRLNLE